MPEHTPAPTPSRAVYGFVLYLSFQIFFIIYLIWALVPEEYFELIGITFLPQRYWAIAVPIYFLIVLTIFAFIIYPSLGLCMTPSVNDLRTFRDEAGTKINSKHLHLKNNTINEIDLCICKDKDKCCKEYYESVQSTTVNKTIPSLKDIDMWEVSENLFLK
ncbi:hypothetical protein NQ314_015781 [Rhamnusium bicolor]|uniref:PIG-P domain-containing protein n=1 Tax=Rhamnusium bicolor TaxID=1586634 RepID=A0AAV8WXL3_9CUCU|nr:hypothetical protein NQ314_015781 [Rhamnusium bicolor]